MTTKYCGHTAIDPHIADAFSATAKFSIEHLNRENAADICRKETESGELIIPKMRPKEWELDVRPLISSHTWLQKHGLKKKRLTFNQILASIGFKFSDKNSEATEKPVSPSYERGVLSSVLKPDRKSFNIYCSKEKLYHFEKQLLQAICLFKRRIEWLTTESRRTFGVIQEMSVTIVLDFCNVSPQRFDQYRTALESVIRQQLSQLAKFNLIRACEDMLLYSTECVPVSHDSIERAVQWIWNLDSQASVSNTAAAEAVLKALSDIHNEGVYLFTEGSSVNKGKEILRHKVCSMNNAVPVHVVSFNCDCSNIIKFLREFAESANGRFHAYAVVKEMDIYEMPSVDGETNRANVILNRKTQGGVPAGAGVRKDVVLIFEELEEARSTLEQIKTLTKVYPTVTVSTKNEEPAPTKVNDTKVEQYMNSKEWLHSNGLEARGLGWHDILLSVAFRHADTVVDLMHPPVAETMRDAIVEQKLINARYCDELFPVVKLKDGQVFHVLVTPEIYRSCEEKIHGVLSRIQQRIAWLNKGSRALFGTLIEEQIYILVDVSASMQRSLGFVKQKLFILMQEQLRHKKKVNIIAFNTKVIPWKDRIVDVSEEALQSAWSWVQSLSSWGSTNTSAAIQTALADPKVEAIYLLTDGRPDQPPSSIICQAQLQKSIPIHTISFNCNDVEANRFLYDLAETTGGRYHYFSEKGQSVNQPGAWESMDIKDLKTEIERGLENLKELSRLRDESSRLIWKKGADNLKKSISSSTSIDNSNSFDKKISESPRITARKNTRRHSAVYTSTKRPSNAPFDTISPHPPVPPSGQPKTVQRHQPLGHGEQVFGSQQTSKSVTTSCLGHKRTRQFHTRSDSGRFTPSEWMLPETRALFQKQAVKQRETVRRQTISTSLQKQTLQKVSPEALKDANYSGGKSRNLTTKEWLARHGLVAKRLTLLDALGCTLVSHRAKYVKILDKSVSGKVFEEIMPMAFVSDNNRMHFINPRGVNLKAYEWRVRDAMDTIRKYLDMLVWEALPQSAKKEFDSDKPVSFENNREKLLMLLKEADWPVAEEDISQLEQEISKGEKYVSQSKTLRKASGENVDDEDEEDAESAHTGTSRSTSRARSVSSDLSTERSREHTSRRSRSRSNSSSSGLSKSSRRTASPPQKKSPSRSRSRSSTEHDSRDFTARGQSKRHEETVSFPQEESARKSRSSSEHGSKDSLVHQFKEIALSSQAHKKLNKSRSLSPSGQINWSKSVKMVAQKISSTRSKSHPVGKRDKAANLGKIETASSVKSKEKLKTVKHTEKWLKKLRYQKKATEQVLRPQKEKCKFTGTSQTIKGKVLVKFKTMKGQKVIARRDEDGLYYPGGVLHCPDPEHCLVRFKCEDETVSTNNVLPNSGAISCPPLYVGDYVLIKVLHLDTMLECFVPAVIERVPQSHSDHKFYTVVMYNGQKATSKRRHLVKISRERFIEDCLYIATVQKEYSQETQMVFHRPSRPRSQIKRPDDRKKHTRIGTAGTGIGGIFSRSQSNSPESNLEDRNQEIEESVNVSRSSSHSRSSSRSSKKVTSPPSSRLSSRSGSKESEKQKDKPPSESNKKHVYIVERRLEKQEKKIKKLRKKTRTIVGELARQKDLTLNKETPVTAVPGNKKDKPKSSWLLEQRARLQEETPLIIGERVLARWSDDGWYYRGIVRHYYGDCSYEIEDSSGYTERIWREDILSENEKQKKVLEVDDHVIALHPKYNFSYAPGIIKETADSEVLVKFYNSHGTSAEQGVALHEVYYISHDKYELDVKYIKKKDDELVHSNVVARCDEEGAYFPGTVMSKTDESNVYNIQWGSGTQSTQEVVHIFGGFTRHPKIQLHSRVLACADPVLLKFLPGTVNKCREDSLSVKFCDGTRQDNLDPGNCFWLGEHYYREAVQYCSQFQP